MSPQITRSRWSYSEKRRLVGKRRWKEEKEEGESEREAPFPPPYPLHIPLFSFASSSPTRQKNTTDKRSLTEQKPQTYGAGFLIVTVLVMGVAQGFNGGPVKGVAASL